jgi:hypothetical protein
MLVAIQLLVVMIIWLAKESLKSLSIQSTSRQTLAMITDEAMTHISKVYLLCLHQLKKATRNISMKRKEVSPSRAYQAEVLVSAPIITVMPQP